MTSREALVDARRRRWWPTVQHGLGVLYGAAAAGVDAELDRIVGRFTAARPDRLWHRDLARQADPQWFQRSEQIGYVCYADRFAGSLAGVADRLGYLGELGVTYLHLMPVLRARDGENDGGYAVQAYDEIDPRLGTMADLAGLSAALHAAGIDLCIDLVVNHTAAEHPWAVAARAGDPRYAGYYFMFPDREMPDRYERTLREVFPDFAPGNFTWLDDARRWVWTTFHEFQWDLDWSNPAVLVEFVEIMLRLADHGVDVLRLDAVPFLWKREGTACENLPEVHTLLTTLRAVMAVAAPATIFKSEAIVSPEDLVGYLGAGDPPRHECDLGYNNQWMVQLWSTVATGDTRVLGHAMRRLAPIPPWTAWVNYLRCHDDIGWAVMDADAAAAGWDGFEHRTFLNSFYSGEFPSSYSRGEMFQFHPDTGDGRISGTAAALCGVQWAIDAADDRALDAALRRLELLYAGVYGFGGIPLVYMGDELGLVNDTTYLADPARHDDNRWMHRPTMDWAVAERRHRMGTVEHRVFAMFTALAAARRSIGALDASIPTSVVDVGDRQLLVTSRTHPLHGRFVTVSNVGEHELRVDMVRLGLPAPQLRHGSPDAWLLGTDVVLPALAYAWLT